MKLLKETYKTYEGARKRCAFENMMAKGEYERGDKAKLYSYSVIQQGDPAALASGERRDVWRVARNVRQQTEN